MSKPEGSLPDAKSLAGAHDSTIAPDDLPPLPTPVKPAPVLKPQYSFLAPPETAEELGRLTKFRVLRLLGKGGMGMVFLAEDTMLHRHVALKVMTPELAANKEAAERFLREARAIAKIRHERIITLYDVGEAGDVPFLVMELLEGLTLHEFLKQGKRLSPAQVARVGQEIAGGLAAAHRHGVIHRDIKPGNIWLEKPAGQVKILDFGLARIQASDHISSISGGLLGTPAYMSPEQALGQALDPRSDLFSLGTVLYQLLTNHLPFSGDTLFALLEAIARAPHKSVLAWHPAVPESLAQLIHHLLEKNPADRPQSGLIVAERLEEILYAWPPTAHQISAVLLTATPPPLQQAFETSGATDPHLATPPVSPQGERRTPPPPLPPPERPVPALEISPPPPLPTLPAIEISPPRREPAEPRRDVRRPPEAFMPAPPAPPAPPASWPPAQRGRPAPARHTAFPKPITFAFLGAVGCLLAAMIFEAPLRWLLPASTSAATTIAAPPLMKVDVVFVLDTTGSMENDIRGVEESGAAFLANLKKHKMDVQVGVVHFRDRLPDRIAKDGNIIQDSKELLFAGKPFTADADEFRREVGKLSAFGGGDEPESSLDALDYASQLPFRDGSAKVLLLITDAPPQIPDKDNPDEIQVAEKLKKRGIQQLHLFVLPAKADRYIEIQRRLGKEGAAAGKVHHLDKLRNSKDGLEGILEGVTVAEIAQIVRDQGSVRALCTEGTYPRGEWLKVVLAIAFWAGIISVGLTLGLIFASMLYLGQALRRVISLLGGSLSILFGLIGGAVAQTLIAGLTQGGGSGVGGAIVDVVAKAAGWSVFGAFVGLGLAFFLSNLSKLRGLWAGALAGLFAAFSYVVFSALLNDMLGRWLGALALGLSVGLLVALLENAFRRWWLEVRLPAGEVRTMTLGRDIISVGSDPRRATVILPEGPSIAFRYFLDGDRVMCEDRQGSFEIHPGDQQQIGSTSVVLCSPDTVAELGVVLTLSTGKSIPLSEGLPLTGADLPGLRTTQSDGTVALVSPKSRDRSLLLLSNRSDQQWKVTDPQGVMRIIDPGLGVTLTPGTQIDFGRIQGQLLQAGRGQEESFERM